MRLTGDIYNALVQTFSAEREFTEYIHSAIMFCEKPYRNSYKLLNDIYAQRVMAMDSMVEDFMGNNIPETKTVLFNITLLTDMYETLRNKLFNLKMAYSELSKMANAKQNLPIFTFATEQESDIERRIQKIDSLRAYLKNISSPYGALDFDQTKVK